MPNVFGVPVFFICFRESLETAIVVSILLSFLKQNLGAGANTSDPVIYKKLRNQIWLGVFLGLLICLVIGGGIIGAFYGLGKDKWANTEPVWEGVFCIVACVVITVVGAALLRISKMQEKWRVKLARALKKKDPATTSAEKGGTKERMKEWGEKYALFLLPFITVLREGLEAVVFIAGVVVSLPATAVPLPTVVGLAAGCFVGYLIYKGGNHAPLQVFLIASTCILYLVAAGLLSRGVWFFESNTFSKLTGGDAAESGSGPGSYDIRNSVWHVNCCNPELNGGGGWGVFNSILGWTNSATVGSVVSYCLYWAVIAVWFVSLRTREKSGRWPLLGGRKGVPPAGAA